MLQHSEISRTFESKRGQLVKHSQTLQGTSTLRRMHSTFYMTQTRHLTYLLAVSGSGGQTTTTMNLFASERAKSDVGVGL